MAQHDRPAGGEVPTIGSPGRLGPAALGTSGPSGGPPPGPPPPGGRPTHSERLYLVDGPSYLYRAYHAIGHLSTSRGIPTNATLGMTMMLWKMLREERPTYMAVAWDAPGPTFRHRQFEAYKLQRPGMPKDLVDQIPWIRKSLDVLGLPVLEVQGFEADDILATAVDRLQDRAVELVLVTADKDALQLVGPKVTVLSVLGRTGERIVYDAAKVLERWGVPPERIPDILALMGDSIDNIPGVPGVGEVTAQKLLRQFGSLEALYENLTVVTGPKLRETLARSRDQAFFSRQLAVLEARVPIEIDLERFRVREPNWERIRPLWTELEFSALLRQVPARAATVPTAEVPQVDEAGWRDWRGRAGALIAIEPVLVGNPPDQALLGLGCYSPAGGACYLASAAELADLRVVGHDVKALVSWASAHGLRLSPDGLDDTAVAAYLLNSGRSGYPLEELCLEAADHTPPGPLAGLLEGRGPAEADPALLAAWAGARAEGVWRLWECQRPLLERDGLVSLYRALEMPLVPVLAAMENAGIRVAPERLELLAKELERQLDNLLREIHGLAGEPVNPNSPKQLAAVLFEKLKLPPLKRTKTGYSTDVDVLEELALGHPLPQKILEYRQLAKLKGTYADALPVLVNARTGRIHTSFNQLVAATGRLSCLPAGTLVSTQRGLLGIEHVRPGDTVRTAHGPRAVLDWESTGLKSVVALHLSNGIVLRCSPEHRLLTRGEWKQASELEVGDPLYMSCQPGLFGRDLSFDVERLTAYRTRKSPRLPAEWSVPLAELVGYAMADGHMARSNYNDKPAKLVLAFGWDDEELMDHFAATIDALFGKPPTRRITRSCPVLEVSGVDICGLLEQLGAGGRSGTIRVPPSIFAAPEPIVAGFLRGYFEGDGSAKSCLAVRSVSRAMLEDVHHLLTLFGIPSSIQDGSPDPRGYAPRHTLLVVGDRSKRRFSAWINFLSERKRRQLHELVSGQSVKSRAELLTLPSPGTILGIKHGIYEVSRRLHGKLPPALYVFMNKYARGRSTVTLPRTEAFVAVLEYSGAMVPAFLADAVTGQYFEVKVERIEAERPMLMYEIAVEGTRYLANGIVVHNSSSPNLQNIPIRSELGRRIRQAFIPEAGWRFMAADYSQIELRIFAHLSGEEALLEAFRRNEDIHTRTAAEILHVPADQVTPEMRRLAKVVNFGILYGISGFGLAQAASISRDDAQRYIEAYFASHPKVRAYIDRTVAEGRERGYVTTLLGRRRYLPELAARNVPARMGAERMAANAPIQGTASDIIKLAMVKLAAALAERRLRARILLQVHDELLLEVPEAEREPVRALVPEIMESVLTLDVPLRVEVKDGRDWAEV